MHDGNYLLSVVFLLQATCRFYFLISIGKLLGGFGPGSLTIFRFVDHMWRNINFHLTKDSIILLAEVFFNEKLCLSSFL